MGLKKDISDIGIVLSRIDYGEKDRIITVITARHGKLRAIAKSVRSAKSRLAGGIELFSENHLVLVRGKSDLLVLTSSRMDNYYGNITKDIDRSMFAYECLKNVNKLTVDNEGSDHYSYLKEVLATLNNSDFPLEQIKVWFSLKLLDLRGVSPNLKTSSDGKSLPPNTKYDFDYDHQCFFVRENGKFDQNHIKILRYFENKLSPSFVAECPTKISTQCAILVENLLHENVR